MRGAEQNKWTKMKITRSFSKKIQVKQYEPVESFCAVEVEIDEATVMKKLGKIYTDFKEDEFERAMMEYTEEVSAELDAFVRLEVEKTINKLSPLPKIDKYKQKDGGLDDFGQD